MDPLAYDSLQDPSDKAGELQKKLDIAMKLIEELKISQTSQPSTPSPGVGNKSGTPLSAAKAAAKTAPKKPSSPNVSTPATTASSASKKACFPYFLHGYLFG